MTKRPLKVMVAIITLWSFLFNTVFCDVTWAAKSTIGSTSLGPIGTGGPGSFKELNVDTFSLPEYLGHIKDSCKGNASKKVVIHIQDAHCNYAAQHKISDIIEYLNKEYGIDIVNLEGGAKNYDLSTFTRIYDRPIREKTADYFVKEGLVNGAEYFAINNPEKATLWGIEDTKLYLDNLNVYRDSLKYKEEVDKHLNVLTHILTNLKIKIYSSELLELDNKYSQYKANTLEFKDYLTYLIQGAKNKALDIKGFTNIYLLSQTLIEEENIDFKKANNQRDDLIDKLQKQLSKNSLEELVLKTVEFRSERISQKDFYAYLTKKADVVGVELAEFPDLQKYIVYIAMYNAIDKMKVMEEMDRLENEIKGALYQNDKQKELNKLSKNLSLLKNIFGISLTKEDYKYYTDNEQSFNMANFVSFISKEAPLYKISARLESNIADIDHYRGAISKFYEYSFKRDKIFIKNIKFGARQNIAVVVTGGFHTENLCEALRKENIAYISIMPAFRSYDGYACPYFGLLAGNEAPLLQKLQPIFASVSSIQIASMLSSAIAPDVWGRANIDAFRAAVLVQEQIAKGRNVVNITRDGEDVVFQFENGSTERMTIRALLDAVHQKDIDGQMERLSEDAFEDVENIDKIIDEVKEFLKSIGASQEILDHVDSLKGQNADGRAFVRLVRGVTFRGHAGGQGIRLNATLKGNEQDVKAVIFHEIVAGLFGDHFLAERAEQAFRASHADSKLLTQASPLAMPIWNMTPGQRLGVDRDFAAINIVPTTFEKYLSTPLLEHDKLIGDELRFIFQLFGHIDLQFVSPDALLQKDSVTQNVYDESGQLRTILCSDKFTAENLIDMISILRNLSPEGQWSWEPLAIRLYSYFHGWRGALNKYSMSSGTSETIRNELANLEAYFGKLAEKIKTTLQLSDQIDAETVSVESNITQFIDRALVRGESVTVDVQQKHIERLELFFSSHLATYLTDQIDRVLIENVFGQFKRLTENWDVQSSRNEILIGMIGENSSEKFSSWLELARSRFRKLQDENRGNPEKLRQLHIQFAQEIGKVIRTQFPDYSSDKYQLGKVTEANKANCVGYATMFYLIAKEIGLNVAYTSVEYTGDKEIHHAANLLHLPSVNGEDSFVVVDVTWNNYVSEPITEASISVQYKDGMLRRIAIPQTMSEHNVVVEYQDPLYGIQHAIYSWASSSNDYLTNPNLKKRVAERMLRINPNDANALRLLGIYYASAEGESAHNINSAISYLQRSLKLKVNWFALHELKRLSLKLGKIGDFYHFCEQLLSVHNSPNTYIIVAHTIKLDNARGNEVDILQKTLAVLEGGLKMFPENSDIMKELASVYMDLFTHLSETSEKRRAYDTAIDYMERTLKKTPADGELLNKYWQLVRKEEAGSERFVLFCSEMIQANPQLAQPVCALMHHYEMQKNEDGYNKAVRLAKEYLEKPESTDRRRVLWSLRAIYTNMVYETDRQGNAYYGKIDDLLQYLHELLGKFPDSFATVQCIAETNVRAKRYGEAIPYLQRFLQRFPHNKECLETLITCQAAVKDWQGVVTTAEATFDADSNNMTALKLAGIAYEESGRYGEAIIKFERFLALYGGYSDASDIKTRLTFCQERARGAMLQSGGSLKDIGIPGSVEAVKIDTMTLMRWEDLAVGENVETKVINGILITAKFIYSEPLSWGAMPKGMSSHHFYDSNGNLVIVGAYYLSEEELNEAFYHEGREAHWITVLSDEAQQSNRELTEGLLNTIRRNAHILASAEESIAFGDSVLTPFHKRQVASMSQGLLEQLLQENRQAHHELIKARLSAADYEKYLSYEQRFVSKLEQKLSMPDRRTQVQELRRLGETLQQQFGISLDDIYLNEDKVSQNQGLLLESDYPEVKALLERTIANLRQSHPAWLRVVRGKTLRIAKLLGEGRNIGGRADLDNGTFTLVLDSYAYRETLEGRVSLDKGIAAADGTKYSNEQWILFHEIAHLMDPYCGQAVSAFFDQAGIDKFLQSDEYAALLKENQRLEAELKQRGLFTSPAPYLVRTPDFIDKLNRIRDEIDKNKYYKAILAKGSRTITTGDTQGYTITPYAGASRFELWAESLTAYFLCPDLLRQKDPTMFSLLSMVISPRLISKGLPAGVTMSRQLYQAKAFETALGEGQEVWLQVYNDGPDNFDNFRVYVNPGQGMLDKAVEIAKGVLGRSDAPHASFKYLSSESLIREQHKGATKLVFYCKTAEDAVRIAQIFRSHPSYGDLGSSGALTDTLPIDNVMMVSGGTREDTDARKPQAIEKLAVLVGAFNEAGIPLANGRFNDGRTRIPANPDELGRMVGQPGITAPVATGSRGATTEMPALHEGQIRYISTESDYYRKGGWKLHLAVAPEHYQRVHEWLWSSTDVPYKHRAAALDDPGDKDFTIYVGSKRDADTLAIRISREIGNFLLEPGDTTQSTDIPLAPKVSGRFDATSKNRSEYKVHQYGGLGIPYLSSDYMQKTRLLYAYGKERSPEEVVADAKIAETQERVWADRAFTHLGAVLGDYFTGGAKSIRDLVPISASIAKETSDSRAATTVEVLSASEGRGNDVKVVVGIPVGMNRANVQSTVSAVNRGLARNGFGRIEDNKQVITFEIDPTDAEKTRQNQEKAMQKAQEGLAPDGRIVLFAPQMEKGPQLAGKAQEQYKGQGHIAIVPDAYTDSSPEQNIYPDVMLRVALGRDIAFYYSGKDPQGTIARINSLLTKVIDGFAPIVSINDLLNILKPLRIRPIDFKTITEWQKAQEAVATSL